MARGAAERKRQYRARLKEMGASEPGVETQARRSHEYRTRAGTTLKPFIGCDGEGCGTDESGRQLYMLFRMGERELFTGQRLRTEELLDFICDAPREAVLVGFAFGYDVTMILRDLSEGQQRRLFLPKVFGEGHSPFVWFKNFDIDYLPKNYFRVRRVQIERQPDGTEKRTIIKGSTRTIYETFGFFQKSFVKVINEFNVGTKEERESIAASKANRSSFTEMGETERQYCEMECDHLAQLMEKLRGYCYEAGIRPSSWSGAGKLAASLHRTHETPKGDELKFLVPSGVFDFANMAYYGGRFEITRTGLISQPVFEYDIRSAYPDGMRHLPCLIHGTWEEASAGDLKSHMGLYVAACSFNTPAVEFGISQLAGLPVRSKEGHLFWPRQGAGVYWSPEIQSAEKLGTKVKLKGGWIYRKQCDCHPFDWVEQLFNYRRSIGSQGPGYPIKLGINSLYGKLAQRKGNGRFNNMIWAGLITAMTRAKLNDAISLNPRRVVMVATDAIYSLDPLPSLVCGDSLGDWEAAVLDGLFIVQPGLYWCPAKRKKKSRGLSGKFFEEAGRTESFENEWKRYQQFERSKLLVDFPSVPVPVPGFIGLKLALARNKPSLAGTWVHDERRISFDYRNKRQGHVWAGDCIETGIKAGARDLVSLPHRDFLAAGGAEPWENARLMLEEQPDYIDLGIPFQD